MTKTMLLTGATDGIGLESARLFAKNGHNLLIHGRNAEKLDKVKAELLALNPSIDVKCFTADLSLLKNAKTLAEDILGAVSAIDVIINNAGVFVADNTTTAEGLDLRFAVNTISPYVLTKALLTVLSEKGRIINLSSAAQAAVDFVAMKTGAKMPHDLAYAQSKLAISMWSITLSEELGDNSVVVSVNPKSFLGSKMVKQAYGRSGYDLSIGADILYRAALSDEFAGRIGSYYDNDYGKFSSPHPFALNKDNRVKLIETMEEIIRNIS